jgi:hypothetical protein
MIDYTDWSKIEDMGVYKAMSGLEKMEQQVKSWQPWLKLGAWLGSLGAVSLTALGGTRIAQSMRTQKLTAAPVSLPEANGYQAADFDTRANNLLGFVHSQAERSLIVSGSVGVVVLSGLVLAARWSNKRSLAREAAEAEAWKASYLADTYAPEPEANQPVFSSEPVYGYPARHRLASPGLHVQFLL